MCPIKENLHCTGTFDLRPDTKMKRRIFASYDWSSNEFTLVSWDVCPWSLWVPWPCGTFPWWPHAVTSSCRGLPDGFDSISAELFPRVDCLEQRCTEKGAKMRTFKNVSFKVGWSDSQEIGRKSPDSMFVDRWFTSLYCCRWKLLLFFAISILVSRWDLNSFRYWVSRANSCSRASSTACLLASSATRISCPEIGVASQVFLYIRLRTQIKDTSPSSRLIYLELFCNQLVLFPTARTTRRRNLMLVVGNKISVLGAYILPVKSCGFFQGILKAKVL